MKSKLLKGIIAVAVTAVMLMGTSTVTASTALTNTPAEMNASYFTKLKDSKGNNLKGTPSLTILKYKYNAAGTAADKGKPIGGIEFRYAKVGNLYQVKDGSGEVMVYGINTEVAEAADIDSDADYTYGKMSFYKDFSVVSDGIGKSKSSDYENLKQIVLKSEKTGADGKIKDAADKYGLYLVIEHDVSGAYMGTQDNKAVISKTQHPFIAALPAYYEKTVGDSSTGFWEEQVEANVKNNTSSAQIEKKIITSDEYNTASGKETGVDTDTEDIGDTVYFHLKSKVPPIPEKGENISLYTITDNISKGFDFNEKSIKVYTLVGNGNAALVDKSNYKFSGLTEISSPAEYSGGKSFTVDFNGDGCKLLSDLAKTNQGEDIQVIVYCSAVINDKAAIGPQAEGTIKNSGNPNRVKLEYKIGSGARLDTDWDIVTEFTFGIDVTKNLEGKPAADNSNIQFIMYKGEGADKKYYSFNSSSGSKGVYMAKTGEPSVDKTAASVLSPAIDGKFYIKGLDEGTYYLEEIATEDGYNLPSKPIKIQLSAEKGVNRYVDAASAADYTGILNNNTYTKDDKDGQDELIVNNTKGFHLPSTGGMGAWIFTAAGILIIAAGLIFFAAGKKKKD
ncbi:MAG: SpaH/EbpB family LPXTG-anchored major pilin [Anaerovoracaceae bacterium]